MIGPLAGLVVLGVILAAFLWFGWALHALNPRLAGAASGSKRPLALLGALAPPVLLILADWAVKYGVGFPAADPVTAAQMGAILTSVPALLSLVFGAILGYTLVPVADG